MEIILNTLSPFGCKYSKIFGQSDPSVLSPLQSKAVLIFEFIKTRRVLSNRKIPFQALKLNLKTTNKENYKSRKWKFCRWKLVAFAKDVQTQVFHPAENWFMVPDRQSTAHRWSTCSQSYFTKSEPPSLHMAIWWSLLEDLQKQQMIIRWLTEH